MFIDGVVEKIWEPQSQEYFACFQRAMEMDGQALLDALAPKKMELVPYPNNKTNCNLLLTSGCSYRIRGRKLVGCSMCDYHTTNIDGWAMMRALRRKDPELYAQAVRRSFENVRGTASRPAFCEQITANDCLDPIEYPGTVLDALFKDSPLFSGKPLSYMFEVLVSNVTRERMAAFRQAFDPRAHLFFDFGVESTQWLRQHWLNKRVDDKTTVRAIEVIHDAGCFAMADILLGIPGLTEEQSIAELHRTVAWLLKIGVDRIVCLPLNRKQTTLQGFLHRQLGDNPHLADKGLAQGEHTGVPWLFTVVEALCRLEDLGPEVYRKLSLAATRPEMVTGENRTAYNTTLDCGCNGATVDALEAFQKTHDPAPLFELRDAMRNHSCLDAYRRLLERQQKAGSLAETLLALAQEIALVLFPDDWQHRFELFEREIAELPAGC